MSETFYSIPLQHYEREPIDIDTIKPIPMEDFQSKCIELQKWFNDEVDKFFRLRDSLR